MPLTNRDNGALSTSTTNVPTSNAVKTYVDAQVGAINSSQWTTNGSNIHFNTGNVGIGTTTPSHQLHIKASGASADINADIALESKANASSRFFLRSEAYGLIEAKSQDGSTAKNLSLNASGGNVGIGTTNPSAKLFVNSGHIAVSNNGGPFLISRDADDTASINFRNIAGRFAIENNSNVEVFSLSQNGNLGVGTSTPAETLHVNGSITVTSCPSDMVKYGGWCMEKTDNAAATYRNASAACSAKSRQMCPGEVHYLCDAANGADCTWSDGTEGDIRWASGHCGLSAGSSWHSNFCALKDDNTIVIGNGTDTYQYRCCKPLP